MKVPCGWCGEKHEVEEDTYEARFRAHAKVYPGAYVARAIFPNLFREVDDKRLDS